MIFSVRRAYVVDPPVTGSREIEWILERTLTHCPFIDGASVFAELVSNTVTGIVIEVTVEAHDEAAAATLGRNAIRSALRGFGVRLTDGLTSAAPL